MGMFINVAPTRLVARVCRTARSMVSQYVPRHRLAITEQSIQMNFTVDYYYYDWLMQSNFAYSTCCKHYLHVETNAPYYGPPQITVEVRNTVMIHSSQFYTFIVTISFRTLFSILKKECPDGEYFNPETSQCDSNGCFAYVAPRCLVNHCCLVFRTIQRLLRILVVLCPLHLLSRRNQLPGRKLIAAHFIIDTIDCPFYIYFQTCANGTKSAHGPHSIRTRVIALFAALIIHRPTQQSMC